MWQSPVDALPTPGARCIVVGGPVEVAIATWTGEHWLINGRSTEATAISLWTEVP